VESSTCVYVTGAHKNNVVNENIAITWNKGILHFILHSSKWCNYVVYMDLCCCEKPQTKKCESKRM